MTEVADRISRLDTSLFDVIEVQLDREDQRSLLALHAACRERLGAFSYLEIGSHLGGSLQAFVRDPACRAIVSLDSRPESQPDERGILYRYPGNNTERMMRALAEIPDCDLGKLQAIERGTDELRPDELPVEPQLALVDGEHTDEAALRDARFCDAVMHGEGCIAFHDAPVVYGALGRFMSELERAGRGFHAYAIPSSIFVVELGDARLTATEPVASRIHESYKAYLHALEQTEPYRAEYRRLAHRLLRRLERLGADTGDLVRPRRRSVRD